MTEWKKFAWLAGIFLVACFLPLGNDKVTSAILEAFRLLQWYAIHHTLACVVPAMFIAGAISTFLNQASVMKYLGPSAPRATAYGVASVAGMILAVCSCSVLPMFAGIYTMGAGLGPATAFLYSGPAINVMAIFLSARVLGLEIGVARVIGAVVFAVIIGFLIFADWYNTNDVTMTLADGSSISANVRYDRQDTIDVQEYQADGRLSPEVRRIARSAITAIEPVPGFIQSVHEVKWFFAAAMGLLVLLMVWRWFTKDEVREWMQATWDFGLLIVPLLFGGVFVTGFIGGLLPAETVASLVGGNGLLSNFTASFVGMIWYFATLTEIPIVEMLTRLGMGPGPALALLLAGPALSLPSILVIYRVIGARKTAVFCLLTVVMSTTVGFLFGSFVS